jgi:hypothetical protein
MQDFLDVVAFGGCFLALAGSIVLGMIVIDRSARQAVAKSPSADRTSI